MCMFINGLCVLMTLGLTYGIDPQYMGCYYNPPGLSTVMTVKRGVGTYGSVKACVDACGDSDYDTTKAQYTYAGIQTGHCYCGDAYASQGPSTLCYNSYMVRCSAEPNNGCGAPDTVSVYRVCPTGRYGDTCRSSCNCAGGTRECRKSDGWCLGCPPGWSGTECGDACEKGKFGFRCATTCPPGCSNNNCDRKLGYCLDGCDSGYGPFCSFCPSINQNPSGPCPFCDHCLNSECVGNGTECYYECPRNWQGDECKACVCTRWGDRCQYACGTTTASCVYCDRVTGECEQCSSGYHGVTCTQCSQNCLNGDCQMDTGACNSCKEGFYGAQCEKNCPMNCGIPTCDRLSGLCEDCRDGFYGETCANECGQCLEGRCNLVTGHCASCKNGYYGDHCKKQCPGHCTNFACEKFDGTCTSCEAGYYGQYCTNVCGHCLSGGCNFESGECDICFSGYYGDGCTFECPPNCDRSCDKTSGSCDSCKHGHFGSKCESTCGMCQSKTCNQTDGACSPCKPGPYGAQCQARCSEFCSSETCNQTTGNCGDGGCKTGHYGERCDKECPMFCGDKGCGETDGACIGNCQPGYYGDYCDTACDRCSDGACTSSGFCLYGCVEGWQGLLCDRVSAIDGPTIGLAVLGVFLLLMMTATAFLLYHFKSQRALNKQLLQYLLTHPSAEDTNNDTDTAHTNAVAMETVSKEYEAIDSRDIDLTPAIYDELNTPQYENVR